MRRFAPLLIAFNGGLLAMACAAIGDAAGSGWLGAFAGVLLGVGSFAVAAWLEAAR